jgi:hypothetical protein
MTSSRLAPLLCDCAVRPVRSAMWPVRSARLGFHNTMADSCLAEGYFAEQPIDTIAVRAGIGDVT